MPPWESSLKRQNNKSLAYLPRSCDPGANSGFPIIIMAGGYGASMREGRSNSDYLDEELSEEKEQKTLNDWDKKKKI